MEFEIICIGILCFITAIFVTVMAKDVPEIPDESEIDSIADLMYVLRELRRVARVLEA